MIFSHTPAARRQLPLRVHIATLFVALILLLGATLIWNSFAKTTQLLLQAADERFERIADQTARQLQMLVAPAATTVDLLAWQRLAADDTLVKRLDSLGYLREAFVRFEHLSALYVGYENGDFFLVRSLPADSLLRDSLAVPDSARYLVQSVERGDGTGVAAGAFLFFDADLKLLRRDSRPDYAFDPRARPWYQAARRQSGRIRTDPYLFFTTREAGITLARRAEVGQAVVGADLTLGALSATLESSRLVPTTQLAVFDGPGQAIAYLDPARVPYRGERGELRLARLSELKEPVLTELDRQLFYSNQRLIGLQPKSFTLKAAGQIWHGMVKILPFEGGTPLFLALAVPRDDLLAEAKHIRDRGVLIAVFLVLLALPVTWLLANRIARHLQNLVSETARIRRFDFHEPIEVHSFIDEVNQLARAMDSMKSTIRHFLDIGSALAAERQFERLLDRVLAETLALARGDAGILFLVSDDEKKLRPAAARLSNREGTVAADRLPPLPLDASPSHPLVEAARATVPQIRPLAPAEPLAEYLALLTDPPIKQVGQLMVVPLRNRQQELVGVLAILKADSPGDGESIGPELLAFITALSGTSAVSIENQRLLQAQKNLFESFIRLLADAIDAKSPYTGGHCARVPALTKLLAQAACADDFGAFRDFDLSEAEWEELHIAAWLHDCGKITTPEYVVDKATKLETLYNRIHEVRTRFEVLKRDAEIAYWRQVADGGDRDGLRADLEARWRALDDDFAFVASCNQGGEFMAPAQIARLKQLAERTWLRTLDDRLGLSNEERARKDRAPAEPLPAVERLLADKPEHRFERRPQDRIEADNRWGFKLNVPELLYHQGEVHNLAVARGTLSEEERYKINEHIVQTIMMLSRLPFPKSLRRVPEIAGGHHETMDGKGYPKRLRREEMSVLARMMAIADIFEALTAIDRPYKSGKTLSEALTIMARMSRERHIDAELFALFLRAGVYRQYAERFLRPEQIDNINIEDYLSGA
ncbi:MAG: HAMP domain-containing protein [Candidatus Competibacteraceae bacterium]|nr:HAMP domain-containing protein [Candidatus Competibacteraceae bacterium]